MRSHIMRIIEGPNSGYAEVRIYPENIHKSTRARKCHKSIRSLVNANRRHAFETCYLEAIENFTPDDYCLTITFPENTPDSERLKHLKNLIKRLQRLYKAFGKVLRYMYFTGRGKDTNMLHFHMLVNYEDEIPWDTIRRKAYKKDKVNAYLSKIRRYRDCGDNMKLCITYLFHHRDSLTAADCEIYKKYWYPSHDLRGFDDCVNTTDGTMHLRKLYNAYIHGSLESYITKAFPGYNLQKYGYYNRDGGSPFYYDLYDRLYCKLIFARKGSMLDTGHYIYHTHGLAIDSITGEVLSDNQSLMGSHDVH